jgi:hypothetical protein
MDPRIHQPTQNNKHTSLYGFDLSRYIDPAQHADLNAHDVAMQAVTHGGIYPTEQALGALGLYDRAALQVLAERPDLRVTAEFPVADQTVSLRLYVNTLGRLHIRPALDEPINYGDEDKHLDIGAIVAGQAVMDEIVQRHRALEADERSALAELKFELDAIHQRGELSSVLEQVIDHIEHVESVCFYVRDRFFALIERFVNLVDDKRNKGFLSSLRDKPYEQWDSDEILVVTALHALFISGRSVRFEEYNGIQLTARQLLTRLAELSQAYEEAGCEVSMPPGLGLVDRAAVIRQQTLRAIGKPWIRYRTIYGLNFQKNESVLPVSQPNETPNAWWHEFGDDYRELVLDKVEPRPNEHVGMALLAHACLALDVAGTPCDRGSEAVSGWLEYLMEKTVASAVAATRSDYGMSSSLRDIGRLITYDEAALTDAIHALTPAHFFTCFVSQGLVERLGDEEALAIATSVQKRMMFNRWHFIPGNLERPLIRSSRHWYYPPLVPDIAIHADMHRAAHNKARVKHSVRSPGPDMSRPALTIAGERYRGFYDVRVVRMEGDGYSTDDMLRVRRRTLWLEAVYDALTGYLMSPGSKGLQVSGFQVGHYADMHWGGRDKHRVIRLPIHHDAQHAARQA